jgi:hypothetical protein
MKNAAAVEFKGKWQHIVLIVSTKGKFKSISQLLLQSLLIKKTFHIKVCTSTASLNQILAKLTQT